MNLTTTPTKTVEAETEKKERDFRLAVKSAIKSVEDIRIKDGSLIINIFGDCATLRAQDPKNFLVGIAWLKKQGFKKNIGTAMNGHFSALLEKE